jgi:hypothetical protein
VGSDPFTLTNSCNDLLARVLHALSGPLQKRNYHVLTFNCRGVGRSTGWPSFTGMSEANDLREVVQWALETIPEIHSLVIIVRYRDEACYGTDACILGLLVWLTYSITPSHSPSAGKDVSCPSFVPARYTRVTDTVPHQNLCRGTGAAHSKSGC